MVGFWGFMFLQLREGTTALKQLGYCVVGLFAAPKNGAPEEICLELHVMFQSNVHQIASHVLHGDMLPCFHRLSFPRSLFPTQETRIY